MGEIFTKNKGNMCRLKAISKVKKQILSLLWEAENPITLKEVSEKIGLKGRSANMHLLGLVKLRHVSKSKKGYYRITNSGRGAIGFPKISKKFADKVLSKTSAEGAFHFFRGIDQPTGILSNSLIDLCEKIKTLDIESIEFHMSRGDFETWISSLGDIELAKRVRMIREENLAGHTLKERIYETLRSRCDRLLKK